MSKALPGNNKTFDDGMTMTFYDVILYFRLPYQSLYGLKTEVLSEVTNFHIRAFHLPTSCHLCNLKI